MWRKIAAGTVGVVAAGVGVVLVNRRHLERATANLVADLLANADVETDRVFRRDDLEDLPAPVRRYLDGALEEGQPCVRTVRTEQRGAFRPGDATTPWKPLEATQHFTVSPPGFVWDAEIAFAPLVSARVVDAYEGGEGYLRAKLLSTVTVADVEPSPEMNAGELLRYLAEAVWFPTALLPGEGVEWEPIDDRSARATLTNEGTTASLVFHFTDDDEVDRVVADRRYRQEDDAYAPWTGYFADYRVRNGMLVPTEAEVEWNLPDGDLPYWRARIVEIDHRPRR
ncbi:DUF6920 family protein [Natribaculum luteum]|uniref:DUF6920 family protein n=1 Tax=Natribaculum luteum TaxID=1586232 RepID=A0ABD5NX43_9EURY|nr:DUF6544 family protein [Natribaculum luteum]